MISFVYLLKMIACSMLLYSYYFFALRNSRHHLYNRIYLLAIPALSVLLPFVRISFAGSAEHRSLKFIDSIKYIGSWEQEVVVHAGEIQSKYFISSQSLFLIIYFIVAAFVMWPFVRSWLHVTKLKRNSVVEIHAGVRVFKTESPGTPFSFLNSIFWNKNVPLNTANSQNIFRHELYHVKQKHSLDLIYLSFFQCFFWINPFNYFIRKELESIHEFLADSFAVRQTDKYSYAELLVTTAIKNKNVLTHQFVNNQIKRRLNMITGTKINRIDLFARIILLPFVLLVFSVFCLRLEAQTGDTLSFEQLKKIDGADVKSFSIDDSTVKLTMRNGKVFITTKKILDNTLQFLQEEEDKNPALQDPYEKTYVKVQIEASYPGGADAWGKFLMSNLHYPKEARQQKIHGTVVIQFIVAIDGTVQDVTALSGPSSGGLKEHAVEVIKSSGKWLPGMQDGKAVRSYKKMPIVFKLD